MNVPYRTLETVEFRRLKVTRTVRVEIKSEILIVSVPSSDLRVVTTYPIYFTRCICDLMIRRRFLL